MKDVILIQNYVMLFCTIGQTFDLWKFVHNNKKLKMKKTWGIVLVVIGIIMIVYTGFNFVTKEKVVDLGPIEINKEKNNTVQWPPVAGIILIVGGIVVIVLDKRKVR